MEEATTYLHAKWLVVLVVALSLALAEWQRPAAKPLLRAGLESLNAKAARWGRNLALFAVNGALSPLIVIPLSAVAAYWAIPWRPVWWSGLGGVALDLLILDLWIYWWHRINHEWPVLWRFHSVHHFDQFLDTTTAVRFHFGEVLISAAVRAVFVLALAIPLRSVVIFEALVLVSTLFHHSNISLPGRLETLLSRFVVTPSIHWVHHHALRQDTDSNYSTILSLWDRLFRTRSKTERTAGMPIGVEGGGEQPLLRLLKLPFHRW